MHGGYESFLFGSKIPSRVKNTELEIRRSGNDQRIDGESNTIKSFTGGSGSYRKDVWTQVQEYHRSLGDVEHGISALINFVEEIQVVYTNITIRVKAVFLAVTQQLSNAQVSSWKLSSEALLESVHEVLDVEFIDQEFLYEHSSETFYEKIYS